MAITFNVNGQKLSPASDVFMASKAVNYPELTFNFNNEWVGFKKFVTFKTSNSELYQKEIVNNSCTVPYEVMIDNELISIGVYGTNDTVRITTNLINAMCYKSGYGKSIIADDFQVSDYIMTAGETIQLLEGTTKGAQGGIKEAVVDYEGVNNND